MRNYRKPAAVREWQSAVKAGRPETLLANPILPSCAWRWPRDKMKSLHQRTGTEKKLPWVHGSILTYRVLSEIIRKVQFKQKPRTYYSLMRTILTSSSQYCPATTNWRHGLLSEAAGPSFCSGDLRNDGEVGLTIGIIQWNLSLVTLNPPTVFEDGLLRIRYSTLERVKNI